jgi:hypothetical protein
MTKFATTLALVSSAIALPFAAEAVMQPQAVEVIEIEVAPEDLARCQETLSQVMQMDAVTDGGAPLPPYHSADLPSVTCVATLS